MSKLPEPRLRDEFRRELRAKLMVEAQTALAPRRDTAWTVRRLLRPAMAFAAAALLLVGGAGAAAASSVPGDPAFVLKRAVEDIQLNLTFDDVQRVRLLAQLADRRLTELQDVAGDEGKAPVASQEYAEAIARFRSAVDTLQHAAPQEQKDKAQDVADTAREKHEPIVDDLQNKVPESAKPALERAIEEEQKATPEEAKDPSRTPRPERSRTPQPSATPRSSGSPHPTERSDDRTGTPRPTPTPRASASADD